MIEATFNITKRGLSRPMKAWAAMVYLGNCGAEYSVCTAYVFGYRVDEIREEYVWKA